MIRFYVPGFEVLDLMIDLVWFIYVSQQTGIF